MPAPSLDGLDELPDRGDFDWFAFTFYAPNFIAFFLAYGDPRSDDHKWASSVVTY